MGGIVDPAGKGGEGGRKCIPPLVFIMDTTGKKVASYGSYKCSSVGKEQCEVNG